MEYIEFDNEIIKDLYDLIKNINFNFEEIKTLNKYSHEIVAIDGGNNYFKDDVLKFFGASLVSIAVIKNDNFKRKYFILFEKVPLKIKKKLIKNIKELKIFGDEDEILKLLNEKDYNFEKIEEENSFTLKIRNLLEISELIKNSEMKVIRDGSFYLPDLINFKKLINKLVKNKSNIMALAKSSKLLRNKVLITNIKGTCKVNKEYLANYYNLENFIFDVDVYLLNSRKKSIYQFETIDSDNLGILDNEIKKGKNGYPRNLILADKFAKASEYIINKIENRILSQIYNSEAKSILDLLREKLFFIRDFE